jgi:CheY-like chemotaxis protein
VSVRRLLVIDDSPLIIAVARVGIARREGWEVLAAESGAEGVELAAAERPDAILLDVQMPDLDGPATLQRLREQDATRDLPVVFLTAGPAPVTGDPAVAGTIAKPFDAATIADQIATTLGWS